jgi:hypothetical protein
VGESILCKRSLSGVIAAWLVVLFLTAALFVPAVQNSAEPYEVTDDPIMTVNGQTAKANAGRDVALLDINKDGFGDLVVGAPGDDDEGAGSGKVMIYLGNDVDKTDPDIVITGSAGERFGYSLALAGDVDGDEIDDLIVGAPDNDTDAPDVGAAYIFLGSENIGDIPDRAYDADVIIVGENAYGQLGHSVSSAGDADMDGCDDVLVGAPYTEYGMAFLFYGGNPMDTDADCTYTGAIAKDRFGWSVAGGLNLDGSTQPDIAIGAPESSSSKGAVRVILNPAKAAPKVVTLTGESQGDRFGYSLAILDFNGDVYGDVAVGAPFANDVGEVQMFYGASTAGKFDRTADLTFSVGEDDDEFGLSIASGDPRTDGMSDLLVGAPENDTAAMNAGRAYVFYGGDVADTEPDVVVEGTTMGGEFGTSVASGWNSSADYNGSESADFAVGAYLVGGGKGAAYLYEGLSVVLPANPKVYGYVLDAKTGVGLANALVEFVGPTGPLPPVRTTSNGSYGISTVISLPPGNYWINASFDDYFTSDSEWTLNVNTRTNVSFDMHKLPVIQGRICDGNTSDPPANPLEDALIEVRDSEGALLDEHTTNATGLYDFMLELEGDVTVNVSKEFYFYQEVVISVAGDANIYRNFTLNHYPIIMFSAEDTEGDPIDGVSVTVSIDGEEVATGETNTDGEATIMVPKTGDAYVNSSRVGYVSNCTYPVTLVQNDTEYVNEIMDRQPSIIGTIKDGGTGSPISGAKVKLYEADSTEVIGTETTNSYGFYSFDEVVEDIYDLRVTATGYLAELRENVAVVKDKITTANFWLEEDELPPSSVISDPQPGLLFDTPTVMVYANATDPNGNDIRGIELYYSHDGKPYKIWGGIDEVAPYEFEFDASEAYGDGIYEFYTTAWDVALNKEPTPTANYTWIIMDCDLPVSEVDALDPYQESETFTVTVTGSDPDGVDYVELWYSYEGRPFEFYAENDTSELSYEFTATDGDGEYAFYSILVNLLGQSELQPDEPDTSTLLDTGLPTAAITSPEDDDDIRSSSVSLRADVTDDGAGLDFASYKVDSEDEVVVELEDGLAEYELSETLELDDGEHTVIVTATDLLGWEASDQVTFRVDTEAPYLSDIEPADGSAVNMVDVEVSWTVVDNVSGVAKTEVRIDGGSWETVTGTSKVFDDLSDDTYTVDIRVTDVAGNDVTKPTTFIVDTIEPTVYITHPDDGELIYSSTVTVRWEQSDLGGSGLEKVEASLDGGDWEVMPTNLSVYEGLSDGVHTVDVRATDKAGNEDTDSVTFEVVDSTAPEISISSPDDGSVLPSNSVTFEWSVTDEGTGVDTVEFKLDAEAWTTTTASGTFDRTGLAEGAHTFSIRAEDNSGNQATLPVQFTIDTLDPTVVIDSPTEGEPLDDEDVLVEYSVDGTGTAATVERSVDGGAWEPAGMASTLVESLSEGAHTVEIRATDGAGHQATDIVNFTVDLGGIPTVTITEPEDGAVIPTDSVTVEWTIENPAGSVEVQLDGGAWAPATGDSATFSDLSDGEHTVTVRTTQGGEDSVTFTVDTTPPTVSISSPVDDAVIDSSSVTVIWTSAGAVTTERSVDGGTWQAVTGTSVTISSLADGEHTISIRVTDVAGHTASDSVTVLVDTTAPTVDVTTPTDGATVGVDVTVEWTASDGSGSGVETVEVSIDGGAWTVASGSSHAFTDLALGQHTVDVRATDFAGNEGTGSVTFTVMVDTTPPTVSITSPTNGASLPSSSVTVTWAASDGSGSGIDTVEVKLNSGTWTPVTTSSRAFTGLAEGSHTVSVRVTDNAGNTATASVTFMVDTVNPTLTINLPEDGTETRDTTVTITWTCTDTGCGIDRIEVSIDDGSFIPVGTASEREFTDLAVGEHTVEVRAYDKAGNMVEASVDFTVTEGGGISALVIAGIVLAIIVVAVVAVMLMRRKKSPAPPAE